MQKVSYLSFALLATTIAISIPAPVFAQLQDISAESQATTSLKPGDQIRLVVTGFPDLSGEQSILSDGTIQIPMAGVLKLSSLTPVQATDLIKTALKPYVRRPQVALSIVSLSPLRISVTGEVLQPGPRLLNPFTQQNQQARGTTGGVQGTSPITLSDVLMVAGGVTPEADLRNVTIRRMIPRTAIPVATAIPIVGSTPFPPGSTGTPAIATMTRSEVKVDLWKVIQSGDLTADSRIYDGDEIVIPRAPANQIEQRTLLTSTIAPGRITVHVAGEVNRPGTVEIAPTARVMDTIAAAGGVNDKANRRSIALFRMSADGKLEQQTVDLEKTTTSLRNGDVLVVSKSGADKFFDTLGKVLTPFYPVRAIIDLFRR